MTLRSFIRRAAGRFGLFSNPNLRETGQTWREVQKSVSGYSDPAILSQVRIAVRKVRDGEATHERDGVNFSEIKYSYPVLAGLLLAAATSGGELRVLDLGGSLGSSYFQNRRYLSLLRKVSWQVIEQPGFVETGNREFKTEELSFAENLEVGLDSFKPNVVLCSSALQYMENPDEVLRLVSASRAENFILDRTPFIRGEEHRLAIQTVPPSVYRARYSCWLLSEQRVRMAMERWRVVEAFDALEGTTFTKLGNPVFWRGVHFMRIDC